MRRLICAALALATLAAAGALAQTTLRADVAVSGPEVTLGDIFEGAGDAAHVVVAAAPAPGERLVMRRAEVKALAQRYDLAWEATGPHNRIEVVRASRAVPRATIAAALEEELAGEIVADAFRVELRSHNLLLLVPNEAPATVAVESLDLDRRSLRFSAMIAAPAGEGDATRLRVSGRVVEITEIPVLNRRVAVGRVIGPDDVVWLALPSAKTNRNIVTEVESLVGNTPRRLIRPGQPVRARDIERPVMVAKGGLVTMILSTRGMTITAMGRATEDGGEGDVIRVRNTRSLIAVEGVVTGPTRVEVLPKPRLALVTD